MKAIAIAVCVSLALAASGPAAAKAEDAPLKLTASGDGRVQCVFADARGNIVRGDLKPGKGKQAEYSNARLDHGSCDYKAAPNAQLVITVEGTAWACPLQSAAGAACAQTFAAPASGSFRLAQRQGS
jgi:hypothetical protein